MITIDLSALSNVCGGTAQPVPPRPDPSTKMPPQPVFDPSTFKPPWGGDQTTSKPTPWPDPHIDY
jgi:hypothetical protein